MSLRRIPIFSLIVISLGVAGLTGFSSPANGAEFGPNDFRISAMGPDGNTDYEARDPAVAYNGANDEFFVVWVGDLGVSSPVAKEKEVFGQRINAATGAPLGDRVRLSDMGTDGDTAAGIMGRPDVAYNPSSNEYLVVWQGDDVSASWVDRKFEIFGQRVNAATGAEVGTDFRISSMGPDDTSSYGAFSPAVAYHPPNNEYLVVWSGTDPSLPADVLSDIFAQRVAGDGTLVGGNKVVRTPDPANVQSGNPVSFGEIDLAYDGTDDEFLIVFFGGHSLSMENFVFGQRLDATAVQAVGMEFRLNEVGSSPSSIVAQQPQAAFDAAGRRYLVVWQGWRDDPPLVTGEFEIFGQFVDAATGAEIGSDFRISFNGADGDDSLDAQAPAISYNAANREYTLIWSAKEDVANGTEIFSQRIGPDGSPVGAAVRLSDMQGLDNTKGGASSPALAYRSAHQGYLAVWWGDDDIPPLVDNEKEIFGQLLTDPKCGNGVPEGGEICDDGNSADTDICKNDCSGPGNAGGAVCGNGVVEGSEECDGGNRCSSDCKNLPTTGTTGGATESGTTSGTTGDETSGGCSLFAGQKR